jgi:hypothetical protein
MSQCYISHRPVKSEQKAASFFEKYLEEHGHRVLSENQLHGGASWVEDTGTSIRSAEYFILLLSSESILSDMLRQELKLALDLSRKRRGRFKILPVRIDYPGLLPYDLEIHLAPLPYAYWEEGESVETVAALLLDAVEDNKALPLDRHSPPHSGTTSPIFQLYDVTESIGAPLPSADPRISPIEDNKSDDPDSSCLESPFYTRRKGDDDLFALVQKMGSTAIVNASRQMGKSSLLLRAHAELKSRNLPSCYLDFRMMDEDSSITLDKLIKELAWAIFVQLKAESGLKPDEVWDVERSTQENISRYLKEALLCHAETPVTIMLDDVDRLFVRSYRDDFFALIRDWHNRRTSDKCWQYLNLVIACETEPHLWLKEINSTPFNIGSQVRLDDFNASEIWELNRPYGEPLSGNDEVEALLELTGGHPFLVRQALFTMSTGDFSLSQLNGVASEEKGPFGDHLRSYSWRLRSEKGLMESLKEILRKGSCEFETHFLRLRSSGLIKGESASRAQLRCKIYKDYFQRHFL